MVLMGAGKTITHFNNKIKDYWYRLLNIIRIITLQ